MLNVHSEGVVPKNKLNRHTVNLRITSNIGKRFSTDAKVTYIHQDIAGKPGVGGGSATINIDRIPRTVRLEDVKNYESVDANTGAIKPNYWYVSPFYGNPYWTVYNTRSDERSRPDYRVGFRKVPDHRLAGCKSSCFTGPE